MSDAIHDQESIKLMCEYCFEIPSALNKLTVWHYKFTPFSLLQKFTERRQKQYEDKKTVLLRVSTNHYLCFSLLQLPLYAMLYISHHVYIISHLQGRGGGMAL
jgi:hypothetical protein